MKKALKIFGIMILLILGVGFFFPTTYDLVVTADIDIVGRATITGNLLKGSHKGDYRKLDTQRT